jgi:hypothetical protein
MMMMEKVAKAPISTYFDITPISRIINYFNIDLKAVDDFFVEAI